MGLLPTKIAETKSRRAREREELSGPPWLPGGGPRAVSPNNPFIDEQPLQSSGRSWDLWLCDTSHQCRNRRFGWRRLRVCLLGNTRDVFRSGFLHRAETGAEQRAWGQSKVALKKCHLLCPSGRGAVEMPSPLTCDLIPTFFFRIALQEETNRMSANALAIVFAPCILRCPDTTDPLQSVQDISKTTT